MANVVLALRLLTVCHDVLTVLCHVRCVGLMSRLYAALISVMSHQRRVFYRCRRLAISVMYYLAVILGETVFIDCRQYDLYDTGVNGTDHCR